MKKFLMTFKINIPLISFVSFPIRKTILLNKDTIKYGELLITDEMNSALAINCIDLGISERCAVWLWSVNLADRLKDVVP